MEFPKQPKSVDESKEAIPVEMYTISGFEEANTDKYLRNMAQDELIKKVAEDGCKVPLSSYPHPMFSIILNTH